ncbi:MAG: STAS domain-containing protein [Lachnospiraceae bacterium]|nr:STAS domain-containing protein [Lachnospiraceae bacterium]
MLNIYTEYYDNNELTVTLAGRLDTTTAPQLDETLAASLDGVTYLVFDMQDLEYISSAGLRVLLRAQKIMNVQGSMAIRNVSEDVYEIFDVTGFASVFSIEQ